MEELISAEKQLIEAEAFLRSHIDKTCKLDTRHFCGDCRALCAAMNKAGEAVETARNKLIDARAAQLSK